MRAAKTAPPAGGTAGTHSRELGKHDVYTIIPPRSRLLLDVCRCVICSHTPLITLGLPVGGACGSGVGAEGLGQAPTGAWSRWKRPPTLAHARATVRVFYPLAKLWAASLWTSARHRAVGIAPITWSMGCCGSKAADVDERDNGADAASKELDRQMAEQQKEEAQVTKLLVLGTGESGKSTIFKQMKILYAVPDPPAKYIPVCRANLIGNAHMVHGAQHVHAEGSWWRAAPLPHHS